MDTLDQVRLILADPRVSHTRVSRGLRCSRKWLWKLRTGRTQDPPARMLAQLHAYLLEHYPEAVDSPPPTTATNLPDEVGASPQVSAGLPMPARALT